MDLVRLLKRVGCDGDRIWVDRSVHRRGAHRGIASTEAPTSAMFSRELPLRSPAGSRQCHLARDFDPALDAFSPHHRGEGAFRPTPPPLRESDWARRCAESDRPPFKRGRVSSRTVVAGTPRTGTRVHAIRLADHAKLVELARQHVVEPIVGPLPRPIINWGRWRKEQAEHRGDGPRRSNDPTSIEDLRHSRLQPLAAYGDGFERVGVIENAETGLGRRKRHRMRGVGAAFAPAPTKLPHDFLAPATTAIG